jgi:N-acetylglucosamine PTS system EIIB component
MRGVSAVLMGLLRKARGYLSCYPRGWLDAGVSQAEQILAGLGGRGNIVEIEACITRLRTEVLDISLVDMPALKAAGAHGVMRTGTVVQVVVGPEADTLASEIEDLI